ncbi:response regulator transcription factor [Nostoc sp. LEGE 12447]|uniref:response regulator transcription factor n=1 Tax=Nostoc sp. LEGE 12447 TaxID=1828640 RepID=UPI001D136ED5|nr:response regulator transcription factor [Nostoc sp. LEGE 12447]
MVVATSPVVRAGLSAVVATNPRLTVMGSASDLDELSREVEQLQPDVVLVDLSSNLQQSVWEKLLLIQEQQYPLGTIAIIEELDSIDLETVLRSGIRGILPSTSTELEIVAAVEAIASGLVVLHPDAVELLSIREKVVVNPVQTLTPREIEVLGMLGSGLGNKAIAKRLQISEHTVKFHLSSIFQKLSVSSRTEAVAVGVRLGLIML